MMDADQVNASLTVVNSDPAGVTRLSINELSTYSSMREIPLSSVASTLTATACPAGRTDPSVGVVISTVGGRSADPSGVLPSSSPPQLAAIESDKMKKPINHNQCLFCISCVPPCTNTSSFQNVDFSYRI
jgi:hypothetical protein